MAIEFDCSGCGKHYRVGDDFAGKRVQCKQCNARLTVPAAVAEPPPLPLADEAGDDAGPLPLKDVEVPPDRPAPAAFGPRPGFVPPAPSVRSPVPPVSALRGGTSLATGAAGGGGGTKKVLGTVVGVLFAVLIIAAKGYRLYSAFSGSGSGRGGSSNTSVARQPSLAPGSGWSPHARAATVPERPELQRVAAGIRMGEVTLTNRIGLQTTVRVFLPATATPGQKLPCVLVAPAGSLGIVGMGLADEDEAEELPYVKHGFAVIAYSLSGPLPDEPPDDVFRRSCEQFHAAQGGVIDAQDALAFALARFPEIDASKVACAGHSSAAMHALNLAAHESRIRACCAYAPAIDLGERLAKHMGTLEQVVPGIREWADEYSPSHLSGPRCPTLLFAAKDDDNVLFGGVQAYARQHPSMKFVTAEHGGHYDAMMDEGIPAGIAFLQQQFGMSVR